MIITIVGIEKNDWLVRKVDLQHIRTFLKIAEVKSFTKTAELLDYAQSSISAQIKSIESELQTKLFERIGREVHLTESGKMFFNYAFQVNKLMEEAKEVVSEKAEPNGVLTIGAPESLSVYKLPYLLHEYRKRYPKVKLVLKLANCNDIYDWLRNNVIDVAFLLDSQFPKSGLYENVISKENIAILAPKEHPLSNIKNIELSDLEGEDMILIEEYGCCYRSMFEKKLSENGIKIGSVQEFGSVETIKKCVYSGLGLSILPQMTIEKEMDDGGIVALDWKDDFNIHMTLVYHKDKWVSLAMEKLMDLSNELWLSEEKNEKPY